MIMNTKNYKPDMNNKREKNYRSVALKSRPCLSDEGASLDGFSVMQIIFSLLSTAAINFYSAVEAVSKGQLLFFF